MFITYKYAIFIGDFMTQSANPLKQFFRQPSIYMRLPSKGNFWPKGAFDMPENQEVPVYPMTAIDEITYRTPDALFNGQAVVNVIQSCVPNIKNAWATPSIDINSILMAIRIASYGHAMEITSRCPACNEPNEFNIDLRILLDQINGGNYGQSISQGDLEITFQPMTYKGQTEVNQLQFEQQKKIQSIQESTLPDDEKIKQLNQILTHITELTVDALKHSISSIRTPQALVTETAYIQEFLNNIDRKIFNFIRDHIIKLRADSEIKPLDLTCTECAHKYQQVVNMDQTSFFEAAS